MAYELFPVEHGGILRVVAEDSYNDAETINADDRKNWPSGATFNSYRRTYTPRRARAPKISGVKPSPGSAVGEYSIRVEVDHKTIATPTLTGASSIAGVPEVHWWLIGGGWIPTATSNADYSGIIPDAIVLSAGSNDQILTYSYDPQSTRALSSLHFKAQFLDSAKTEALTHEFKGARHGWVWESGPDGIFLNCTGKSLATLPVKDGSPTTTSALTDITPARALGGNVSVTKLLATAATYGKSSETGAAASMTGDAWGLKINSNLEVVAKDAPHGTYGVSRVLYNPGVPTAEIMVDAVQWSDDWDLYTFADERRAIRISYAIAAPGSTTDFIVLVGTWFIVDYAFEDVNGYWACNLKLELAHPDNSDGGGLDPSTDSLTLKYVSVVAA